MTALILYPAGNPQSVYKIPDSVETIEGGAFLMNPCPYLLHLTLPAGLTEIKIGLLSAITALESIAIPVSVTSIDTTSSSQNNNLAYVFYAGTKEQYDQIDIWNTLLSETDHRLWTESKPDVLNAVIHYNATWHTPDAPIRENEVDATTDHGGSYDEVVCCTVCGKELSRTAKTTDPLPQPEQPGNGGNNGNDNGGSFLDTIRDFFQKILDFFKNLFN